MPRLVEKLRQLWERFWALPRLWKGSVSGGAIVVFVALIVGVVLATGGDDNTAVSGVVRGPTPTAQKATPTRVPAPTPNPTPTVVPSPNPTLTPTATISALGEQQPPSAGNPPPPTGVPTPPPPAPSPTPKPVSTPMPIPTATPTLAPHSTYWVLCAGRCWFLAPEIQCAEYRYSGGFRKACASPGFPVGCSNFLPSFCTQKSGWFVRCDVLYAPGRVDCDHSLDGSFSCGLGVTGTRCSPNFNYCTPIEDHVSTCSRYDLGTDVTCTNSVDDQGILSFACHSPTVGSCTCVEHDNSVNSGSFTCP